MGDIREGLEMIDPKHTASIGMRLQHMVDNVRSRKFDPRWRQLAVSIVNGRGPTGWVTDPRRPLADIRAIYNWVLDNIRYTSDPRGKDVYYSPEDAIRQRAGDCDEHATLVSLFLETLGYPTKFRSVSRDNEEFSHVYAMVSPRRNPGGPWLVADTVIRRGVGTEVRYAVKLDAIV